MDCNTTAPSCPAPALAAFFDKDDLKARPAEHGQITPICVQMAWIRAYVHFPKPAQPPVTPGYCPDCENTGLVWTMERDHYWGMVEKPTPCDCGA